MRVPEIVEDITERKRAQEQICEIEYAQRDAVFLTNTDDQLIVAKTKKEETRSGKQAGALVGGNTFDLFPDKVVDQRREHLRQVQFS